MKSLLSIVNPKGRIKTPCKTLYYLDNGAYNILVKNPYDYAMIGHLYIDGFYVAQYLFRPHTKNYLDRHPHINSCFIFTNKIPRNLLSKHNHDQEGFGTISIVFNPKCSANIYIPRNPNQNNAQQGITIYKYDNSFEQIIYLESSEYFLNDVNYFSAKYKDCQVISNLKKNKKEPITAKLPLQMTYQTAPQLPPRLPPRQKPVPIYQQVQRPKAQRYENNNNDGGNNNDDGNNNDRNNNDSGNNNNHGNNSNDNHEYNNNDNHEYNIEDLVENNQDDGNEPTNVKRIVKYLNNCHHHHHFPQRFPVHPDLEDADEEKDETDYEPKEVKFQSYNQPQPSFKRAKKIQIVPQRPPDSRHLEEDSFLLESSETREVNRLFENQQKIKKDKSIIRFPDDETPDDNHMMEHENVLMDIKELPRFKH